MLLKFDGDGQGRIIYSVGNPDTAQHPRHVWAQEADGDYVPRIGQYGHGGWTWRHGFLTPSEAPFGGNITTTDGSGHSDYWNRDSVSLDNQAAVVVGQYTEVGLEHGSAPQ